MINISVKFNDLVNGLSKILKTNFPNYKIYADEIIQGFQRPAFHINLQPLSSNNFNQYYREQNVLIDITYFSDSAKDLQLQKDNFEMANNLENVLNTDLKVLDRNLNIQELEFDVVDKILHTTINLMWYNENEVTKAYLNQFQIMQHFYLTINNECWQYYVTSTGDIYKTVNGDFFVKCIDNEIAMLRDQELIKI